MQYNHIINHSNNPKENLLHSMLQLRFAVFKKRLDWDVNVQEELEVDDYDQEENVNYVVVSHCDELQKEKVIGCMRLLPTTGKYMLKDTFQQLTQSIVLPEQEDVWEISRFAVDNTIILEQDAHKSARSFGTTSKNIIYEMCQFALNNNISYYITLTTTHVEKLIINLGLSCRRVGDVQMIDGLKVVILEIIMDQNSFDAVNKNTQLNPSSYALEEA